MNKGLFAALESANIGGFVLGLTLADIYAVLGIISFAISIISGILVIVLKIKKALEDKKLTTEEIEDIKKELEELEEKTKNYKK